MSIRVFAVLSMVLCVAVRSDVAIAQHAAGSQTPTDWNSDLPLAEAEDINPDPEVVEVNITAKFASVEVAPGKRVNAWTYNGGLPGPFIRAQGRRSAHRALQERTRSEPTTVHWHGVRVPIEMDGVPGISQPEVETGRAFTYDFVAARCVALLVSPARLVGGAGRLRPLRRAAGRGSGRRRRRRRPAHAWC